jgi:hypothetical protein
MKVRDMKKIQMVLFLKRKLENDEKFIAYLVMVNHKLNLTILDEFGAF